MVLVFHCGCSSVSTRGSNHCSCKAMEQAASCHGSCTRADLGLLSAQPSPLVMGPELLSSPCCTSARVSDGNGIVTLLAWLKPRAERRLVNREHGAPLLHVPT